MGVGEVVYRRGKKGGEKDKNGKGLGRIIG